MLLLLYFVNLHRLLTPLLSLLLLLLSYPPYPILNLLLIYLLFFFPIFFVIRIISLINYNIITYFTLSVIGIKLFDTIIIFILGIIALCRYSYRGRILRFAAGSLGLLNRLAYLIRKDGLVAKRITLLWWPSLRHTLYSCMKS